jgi:hypothetical protein
LGRSKLSAKPANDRLQDLAIGMELPLFRELLEISVKLEERRVVDLLSVGGQNAMKCRQNTGFPVDERAIAVKGENFKAGEIEHSAGRVLC